uniref:lysozyme n=1 Tax=Timema cristinae TaxID=61476 RepID=A0A7R9CPS8_TIMCR|nr:unnamed protein product [Timema cristinae]
MALVVLSSTAEDGEIEVRISPNFQHFPPSPSYFQGPGGPQVRIAPICESSRDTAEIGRLNDDGSEDHGLFQISDSIGAEEDTGATDAMSTAMSKVLTVARLYVLYVTFPELRTDDITKAARCAMTVFQKHGFLGWMGWKDHCQESLPDISCCFQGHSEF